jgi:3-phosphoshikimate 1-carboxyvinyltransferase
MSGANKTSPSSEIFDLKRLPGSKYWANRYLVLAALGREPVRLSGVPENDDVAHLCDGLRALGHEVEQLGDDTVRVVPQFSPGKASEEPLVVDCGDSGTMARFMAAVAALGQQPVTLTGSPRLCSRPMRRLLEALHHLGAQVDADNGRLPVTIRGPLDGGEVELDASESSQFVSALLLVGAKMPRGLTLHRRGREVSSTYINMTVRALERAGVGVHVDGDRIQVAPGEISLPDTRLPVDATTASYFMMAGALGPRPTRLQGFVYEPTTHGESRFVDHLARMGVQVELSRDDVVVNPCSDLLPVHIDCADCPDVFQSLAVMAVFAAGKSRFTGLSALKHKESDRISDTAEELRKLGVDASFGDDWMSIVGGGPLRRAVLDSHGDHRMVMSLAQLAWRFADFSLSGSAAVRKSFPDYWERMAELGLPDTRTLTEKSS